MPRVRFGIVSAPRGRAHPRPWAGPHRERPISAVQGASTEGKRPSESHPAYRGVGSPWQKFAPPDGVKAPGTGWRVGPIVRDLSMHSVSDRAGSMHVVSRSCGLSASRSCGLSASRSCGLNAFRSCGLNAFRYSVLMPHARSGSQLAHYARPGSSNVLMPHARSGSRLPHYTRPGSGTVLAPRARSGSRLAHTLAVRP